MHIALTNREKRGRLLLAIFFVVLATLCLASLVFTCIRGVNTGHVNIIGGILLPVCELCILALLWTGDSSTRWSGIIFYGLRGGIRIWPVVVLGAGASAITPAEHAAASHQILFLLLPAIGIIVLPAVLDFAMCALLAFSPSVRLFLHHQQFAGSNLRDAIGNWWQFSSSEPKTQVARIGEVRVHSGTLLIADPMYIQSPLRVENVPAGTHSITACLIRYPEGSARIAHIQIQFRSDASDHQKLLGKVGVDSAMIVVVDEKTRDSHWKEVGTERIGRTGTPDHNQEVAALIEKEFGLAWQPVNGFECHFLEPISEELEQRIASYLEAFPEYAKYSFMYFRVETKNTFEQIQDAMSDVSWAEIPLADADQSEESLFVFSSGFGDGSYDAFGHYCGEQLTGIEITFIGPEQDKLLEGFPILRYGNT